MGEEHLAGLKRIAGRFGVSARTVRVWIRAGAPIILIGRKYQANYLILWQWLLDFRDRHKP